MTAAVFPYPELLDGFVRLCREAFGENLAGVYLHGSAALGSFHPTGSDVDLLVAVEREPEDGAKRIFMDGVLRLSASLPCKGIETSVVLCRDCVRQEHPILFVLHFSETHRAWYMRDPEGYLAAMRGRDRDLAAHFAVTRACGICLYGKPASALFGEIRREDYADAILYDVENAPEEIGENPVYLTLNLCRGLAYLREGVILSKSAGGDWGLQNLPERFGPWIRRALDAYREGQNMDDGQGGEDFAAYMVGLIRDAL